MDCIKVEQLKVFAYHGCNEEEKINGQNFFVDACIKSDITTPGVSDDLDETINYAKICKFINKFLTENRYNLIEAAAYQTATGILKEFPKVREVTITINKPEAPISLEFGNVSVTKTCKWNRAYLSIGSNMGDKEQYLNDAVESLYDDDAIRVKAVSNYIVTKPYGPVEQDDFLNGCVEIETLYSPKQLLDALHAIEKQAGRTREVHWGPRTLDMDIIFYNDCIINEPDLVVPHIEMAQRAFVLEPLKQIAPGMVHPVYNKTVKDLCDDLNGKKGCGSCSGCPCPGGQNNG